MKKILKFTGRLTSLFIAILIFLYFFLQLSFVQSYIIKIVAAKLQNGLGTEVSIKHVNISFFNKFSLDGTLIRDQKKDTLIYADQVKLNITDWFFIKENVKIKYIGLEGAVIKANKYDSVWNYDYIVDYFSSPAPKKSNGKKQIEIELNKLDIRNVRLVQTDYTKGKKMSVSLGKMLLLAQKTDLSHQDFNIKSIQLDNPSFTLLDFKPITPLKENTLNQQLVEANKKIDTSTTYKVQIDKITINNGRFAMEDNQKEITPGFNGSNMIWSKINGQIMHTLCSNNGVKADVDFATNERCGLNIRKLKAHFILSSKEVSFENLDLQTNKSRFGNYFSMSFSDMGNDFSDFINKVVLRARLKSCFINSDDLGFFAAPLSSWKKEVLATGNFLGTISNFSLNDFYIHSNNNSTSISGRLAMKGLPDINKTNIDYKEGVLTTNYTDLATFFPALARVNQVNLSTLGNIVFKGNFFGTIHNFTTKNTIGSSIGSLESTFTIALPKDKGYKYEGEFSTERFNLGKFIGNTTIGLINYNGKINGESSGVSDDISKLDGSFSLLEFNGYPFAHILTTATYQKKSFKGEVKIDDDHLDFTSDIDADFSNKNIRLNVLGDLVKCDLKNINITPNANYSLAGLFDLDFSGSNIDDFTGSAKLLNANLSLDKNKIEFDSLVILSTLKDSIKKVTIASNEFQMSVSGPNFTLLGLPALFQHYFHRYFPSMLEPPLSVPQNQKFNFSLTTKRFSNYALLIDKKLSGLDNLVFEGMLDQQKDLYTATLGLPFFGYDKYKVANTNLKLNGSDSSFVSNIHFGDIHLADSIVFPSTQINLTSSNDITNFEIQTKAENTLNDANIASVISTYKDGATVTFKPSFFIVNGRKWNVEKDGVLSIKKDAIYTDNIKLSQGKQEIRITSDTVSHNLGKASANKLVVRLKNILIGDLSDFFIPDGKVDGVADGTITIEDIFSNLTVKASINTDKLTILNDTLGKLNLQADYNQKSGIVGYHVDLPNPTYKLKSNGSFNTKDTISPLAVNLLLDNTKIDLVQQLLGDVFTDIKGKATGNLSISGNPSSPDIKGKITLKNGSLKVNFTQVNYKIDSATITFSDKGIDLGDFIVKDKYNNIGTVSGTIAEKHFKDMFYDIVINTNNLLLIDTKPKDNNRFYGNVLGKASLSFYGPSNDASIELSAEPTSASHIYIPSSLNRESGDADFIEFESHGSDIKDLNAKNNFNLSMDMDMKANEKLDIDVILDELTGDVIKANGNGRLRILANTAGEMSMKGRYAINHGRYNFNFQSFIKKPFDLLPDAGSYIEWTGDPMNASLHIDATYTAENVSVNDLLSGQQATINSDTKTYRGQVFVIAQITGNLTKPDISFKLDFPQNSPIKNDAVFTEFLNTIQNNQSEALSQASSLIVFGTFAPFGQGFLNGNLGGSNTITTYGLGTITQVITKEVNKKVSDLLYRLTKDKSLKFDIGANAYSSSSIFTQSNGVASNSNAIDRSRLNFKLGKSFFDEKVVVTFGGDLDFNIGATSNIANGNLQWLPDLNVEFILSADRRLRAVAFSKNSLDLSGTTLGRRNREGMSLSYKRDFENQPFEKKAQSKTGLLFTSPQKTKKQKTHTVAAIEGGR